MSRTDFLAEIMQVRMQWNNDFKICRKTTANLEFYIQKNSL